MPGARLVTGEMGRSVDLSASDNAALVEAVSLQTDVDAEKGITDLDARYLCVCRDV